MRELVLEPLGMRSSTYENPLPERLWDQAATGHRAGAKPVSGYWHVYPEMAAAGLWTTASDLARCAIGVQQCHVGTRGALLSRTLTQEMLEPQVPTPALGDDHIGIGFFLSGLSTAQ